MKYVGSLVQLLVSLKQILVLLNTEYKETIHNLAERDY
jgi:hypothetical protein